MKFQHIITTTCSRIIILIGGCIISFLLFQVPFTTCIINEHERIFFLSDSPVSHILSIVLLLLFIMFLRQISTKLSYYHLLALSIIMTIDVAKRFGILSMFAIVLACTLKQSYLVFLIALALFSLKPNAYPSPVTLESVMLSKLIRMIPAIRNICSQKLHSL